MGDTMQHAIINILSSQLRSQPKVKTCVPSMEKDHLNLEVVVAALTTWESTSVPPALDK
jgi:hypothetical protein